MFNTILVKGFSLCLKLGGIATVLALGMGLFLTQPAHAQGPVLQSTNPVSNSHTAPLNTTVSATYDQNMDVSTVNTQTFAVHAMQTGLLSQTYSVNGGQIILTPNNLFKPGEMVQVSATTGTLNITGTNPLSPTVWQFRAKVESGAGQFVDSGQNLGNRTSLGVNLGDLDGDGDLDAFVANSGANTVWLNDGTSTFTDTGQTLGNASSAIALGDLDGDGDLDAFDVDFNSADKVWLNDGAGNFSDSGQNLNHGVGDSTTVALGDVDGDGDLDAYVGDYNGEDSLWLNDGQANFTDSNQSLRASRNNVSKLGDLDGDGDLDLFFVTDLGTNDWVWFNDGAGNFSSSGQTFTASNSWGLAIGDVDDDGDLDAYVGSRFGANTVWLNDGTGQFTNSGQSLGNSVTYYGIDLGDIDGDRDLDAFVGNNGQDNKIWLNDGSGTFTETQIITSSTATFGVALGDLDDDGDLDAFVANGGFSANQPNTVWLWELNVSPEIDLQGSGQSIVNGAGIPSITNGTDFGSATIGAVPLTHTFTISNSGTSDLILSGTPAVTLTNGTHFSITAQPSSPVVTNSTTTFNITFAPTASGSFTDTVNLTSNDSDETPYTFVISGTGVDATFDLAVSKTAVSNTISDTITITYTVSVHNLSSYSTNATGVVISDTLPISVTLVTSSTTNSSSYASTTGIWDVGNVDAGTGVTMTLVVTGTNVENIVNTAVLTASTPPDTNSSNNSASITSASGQKIHYFPLIFKN